MLAVNLGTRPGGNLLSGDEKQQQTCRRKCLPLNKRSQRDSSYSLSVVSCSIVRGALPTKVLNLAIPRVGTSSSLRREAYESECRTASTRKEHDPLRPTVF